MKLTRPGKSAAPRTVVGASIDYGSLPHTPRPAFTDALRFPDDITELGAANISELLGKYTKLWAFVNQDRARLRVQLIRLQQQEGKRINNIFRQRPTLNNLEKWKREAVLSEDEVIEQIRANRAAVEIALTHSEMFLENYDRYTNALSRELTRKTHEMSSYRA